MTPTSAAERRQPPCQIPHARQRGFTLLELMVVLAIVLLAAAVIVPRLGVLDSKAFDAEVRRAVALLNYSRRLAIVEGVPQTARFEGPDAHATAVGARQAVSPPVRKTAVWSSSKLQLEFRQELNQKDGRQGTADITFFPQGGSTGGVLDFTQDDFRAHVRVDPITGRISTAWRGETLPQEVADAKQ